MSERDPVYLDYAATTPVDPDVARAMTECLEQTFGNPSSATHVYGLRAAALVERARSQVALLIGAQAREIVFTSGTTESNNLAILGLARKNADRGKHIVTSRIEHKSVLDPCQRLVKEGFVGTFVEPDKAGRIDPECVRAALRPDTQLVSIQHVNNEIGVIQDIDAISALCRERGVVFHTDAAQSAGKIPVDVSRGNFDCVSFSAHKLYGPKGVGALYVRESLRPLLAPLVFGGGQERGLRSGTLPVHQIVGFGAACDIATRFPAIETARQGELAKLLWSGLEQMKNIHLNGAAAPRVASIVNVSIEGVNAEMLIASLPDLALSTGSACDSASGEPSFVLRALGRASALAESSLRFSLGRQSTRADIEYAVRRVHEVVSGLREESPANALHGAAADMRAQSSLTGEAGGPQQEAWVRWHLTVQDGCIAAATYQAQACPHTVAVLRWLQTQLPGRSPEDLVPGSPLEWAARLGVPDEKLGRLLLVEDALEACMEHDLTHGNFTH